MFVQCDQCRSTWDVSVLDLDKESHETAKAEQFSDEAIRASVLVTLVDGTISENEIATLQRVSRHLLQREIDRDELGRLCSIAQQNGIEATNYVLTISKGWDQNQRDSALQAMFLAATADPEMSDEKLAVLARMREILEMTDAEYQRSIESALLLEQYV
tara:strand:+ start:238 stop:714 length:477 start_codon:yes stop_codon:yes gene_type:complete